jgi:hypothetical protein
MTNFQRRTLILLAILSAICIAGVLGALVFGVPKYYSLVRNAQFTTGTVTSLQPKQHMLVEFEYKVNGRIYTSGGKAENIGRPFYSIQIGDTVPVYYDASDPASASMGDPDRYLTDSMRVTGVFMLMLSFAFFLYFLKKRYRDLYRRSRDGSGKFGRC